MKTIVFLQYRDILSQSYDSTIIFLGQMTPIVNKRDLIKLIHIKLMGYDSNQKDIPVSYYHVS